MYFLVLKPGLIGCKSAILFILLSRNTFFQRHLAKRGTFKKGWNALEDRWHLKRINDRAKLHLQRRLLLLNMVRS